MQAAGESVAANQVWIFNTGLNFEIVAGKLSVVNFGQKKELNILLDLFQLT